MRLLLPVRVERSEAQPPRCGRVSGAAQGGVQAPPRGPRVRARHRPLVADPGGAPRRPTSGAPGGQSHSRRALGAASAGRWSLGVSGGWAPGSGARGPQTAW